MSDSRAHHPQTCGNCARVSDGDLRRGYCPVTAACIHRNRPAGRCKFFVEAEDCGSDGKPIRRMRYVR